MSNLLVKVLMKVLPKPAPEENPRPELMCPNETITFTRGVMHNQKTLKIVPKGRYKFVLIPEPTNKVDKNAVIVALATRPNPIKVGYLPAGQYKTEHFQELATKLNAKGVDLVCNGVVEKFDGGIGVHLELPKMPWIKEQLAQD